MSETTKLCECGCGQKTSVFRGKPRRFIYKHHLHCQTEETRLKKSNAMKGKLVGEKNPMWNKHPTKETRQKLSDKSKGINNPNYGKISAMRGKKQSEGTKKKMSLAQMGHITSSETRIKIGNANKGKKPMLGFKHSTESKKIMSESKTGKTGENSSNWRGGISFEPYCPKFNNEFKELIRNKFNRLCFLCGKTETENGRKLSVHHVNYDKSCLCADYKCEFVPLCSRCHLKTNGDRDQWEQTILKKLMI